MSKMHTSKAANRGRNEADFLDWQKTASLAHAAVARCLGYTLSLNEFSAWRDLSLMFEASLTAKERAAIAWAVLLSITREQAGAVIESIHGRSADWTPMPHFMDDVPQEAQDWAALAPDDVVDAYALACFRAMTPDRQAGFLDHLAPKSGEKA